MAERTGRASLEWHRIEVGDVLKAPSGLLRIVRSVHRNRSLKHPHWQRGWFVYMTIQRCSWTRRPYTLYNIAELIQQGYQTTGVRVLSLNTKFDKTLAADVEVDGPTDNCTFRCCDTVGIP